MVKMRHIVESAAMAVITVIALLSETIQFFIFPDIPDVIKY